MARALHSRSPLSLDFHQDHIVDSSTIQDFAPVSDGQFENAGFYPADFVFFNDEWMNNFRTSQCNIASHSYGELDVFEYGSDNLEADGVPYVPGWEEIFLPPTLHDAPDLYEWNKIERPIEFNETVFLDPSDTANGFYAIHRDTANLQPPISAQVSEPGINSISTSYAHQHSMFGQFADQDHRYQHESYINTAPCSTPATEANMIRPPAAQSKVSTGKRSMEDGMIVFETGTEARPKKRKRRPLTTESRLAFQKTRAIGACHQCKFRKQPCRGGTPCSFCSISRSMELSCQRGSPFVQRTVTIYFPKSSKSRVVDFDLQLGMNFQKEYNTFKLSIDGRAAFRSPFKLNAFRRPYKDFEAAEKLRLDRTVGSRTQVEDDASADTTTGVVLLVQHEGLGEQLEQWVIQYATFFASSGPQVTPMASAHRVGLAYVRKTLPEHQLVLTCLRVMSLGFVLQGGVQTAHPSRFRTVQAQIDTILFHRLLGAEDKLHRMLHKIVYQSNGVLQRNQYWPVAYVLWQMVRALACRTSHLANLSQNTRAKQHYRAEENIDRNVDDLEHTFNLLLSVHNALFRTASPLLLDYDDLSNQDLLDNDKELVGLAMQLRASILWFRGMGFPKSVRAGLFYNERLAKKLQGVLTGM